MNDYHGDDETNDYHGDDETMMIMVMMKPTLQAVLSKLFPTLLFQVLQLNRLRGLRLSVPFLSVVVNLKFCNYFRTTQPSFYEGTEMFLNT